MTNYSAVARRRFEEATSCFGKGLHERAYSLCREVLNKYPEHGGALHLIGVIFLRVGRSVEAADHLRRALVCDPNQAEIHANLGNALLGAGSYSDAMDSFDRALSLQPGNASAWNNRGHALLKLSRLEEALESFERALAVQPNHVRALNNKGTALLRLGRPAEALAPLQQVLNLVPDYAEALCNLGSVKVALGGSEEALPLFDRALALKPGLVDALLGRADVLSGLRRWTEALADYENVLSIDRHSSHALTNGGSALLALGRISDALACYASALQVDPNNASTLTNRGVALSKLQRLDEALVCLDEALVFEPDFADALYNRVAVLHMLGRTDEIGESIERLYAIDPKYAYAPGLLLHFRQQRCDWKEYEAFRERIITDVAAGHAACMPFHFLAISDSPELQLRCAERYTRDECPDISPPRAARRREGRIRIAYVSSDLRSHAVSVLMAGVFREHDRSRFEVIALALQPPDDSEFAQRVVRSFDRFCLVQHLTDLQIVHAMRDLNIDIAVDLMGHTLNSRPGIFAQRPAPMQIQHLGFPGTTGAPFIDYLIADEFLIPEGERVNSQERLILMPHSFQSNDDRREITAHAPTRAEAGLPDETFVYCSFNNAYKITPTCFATWMRLLLAVPRSVLWLVGQDEIMRANLRSAAEALGVDSKRIIFASRMPYAQHLARLALADLFLDTLPFNGGTTVSDALWAGVPVLTCPGRSFAARMAGSLLHALDLGELVAASWNDYESRAVDLALNDSKLSRLRGKLASNRVTQPLFNTSLHTRHLEYAYEIALGRAMCGEPHVTFRVPEQADAIGKTKSSVTP